MAKQKTSDVSELEALAGRLDALQAEASTLGEERVAKSIGNAAKSARWFDKQRSARLKKVGTFIQSLQAKGLSAEEILSQLTR